MTQIHHLPQELIDLILDHLVAESCRRGDASRALRACTLVSRRFLRQSRKHLFRHLQFVVDSTASSRSKRFLAFLQDSQNAYLSDCIKSFRLVVDVISANVFHPANLSTFQSKINYAGKQIFVPNAHLISLLKQIQDLPLHKLVIAAQMGLMEWPELKDDFKDIFMAFRANPNLRTLEFSGVHDIDLSLITGVHRSGLKHLSLQYSSISIQPQPDMTPLKIDVDHLEVITVPRYRYNRGLGEQRANLAAIQILPHDVSTAQRFSESFSKLTKLSLTIPLGNNLQNHFWRTVTWSCNTLQSLVVHDFHWIDRGPFFLTFPLPGFPHLKALELKAHGDNILYCTQFLPEVFHFTQFVSAAMTSVETLTLDLTIEGRFWNRTDRIKEYFFGLRSTFQGGLIESGLIRSLHTMQINLRLIDNHQPWNLPLPNLDWPPTSIPFCELLPPSSNLPIVYHFYAELTSNEGTMVLFQDQ